ncbi:nuclear transport factor 2 family protein [Xinfangfangia sp. D13-10-4-6]|uniref:nuclear transport factor 2 family protein n=1 Tax=Pseudogemmobacter hezensis TaxID=2737662 RepID=UPI001556EF5E|nr:nuclear transport factor 2 family protein [Pseudogemmobacter hezensis]NPD17648.1 nuclear transport factor 2 family protein [Pseudogemmobacter hezensis]
MTTPVRAVIDRMFTAFNAKDLPGALATVSDDTLWIHHGSQKMPSVRFEGKSGAEKFFGTSFSAMKIDYFRPLTFIEQGDKVVVLGEESYVMDGIEGKLSNKWVQVYTVANGLITKMEEFATSADPASYLVVS